MKACTIKNKYIYTFVSLSILFIFWEYFSRKISPLVLPSPLTVGEKLINILTDTNSLKMILITINRLFIGFIIGLFLGFLIGSMMGLSEIIDKLVSPIIGIIQTIPPVSWLVLALVWFGFNGKPAIFIIVLSTLPIITISVKQGFNSIDINLLEMASIYNFSNKKIFLNIILPTITPFVKSGCLIALGNSWKIAAMAEVLTTTDGIGGMIKLARLNIEPDNILAWSIIIVILYFISKIIINKLFHTKEEIL